jgi:hypothetical protein
MQFKIDGIEFEFEGLGLDDTFVGFELTQAIVGPVIESLRQQVAAASAEAKAEDLALSIDLPAIIQALTGSFGKVPQLLRLFASATKVKFAHGGKAVPVKLELQLDETFKGKQTRAILYCANCILLEYADFLDGGLGRVTEELAALFQSRMAATRSSGG